MEKPAAPCRLFVYLARDAPIGVVLRRGPSAWARLSLWRTNVDTFEHGQWFRGRVYERRCDLSPDGSLFAYFARKTDGRTLASGKGDSWIAISRAPWFKALALWFVGGTYCAGAYFPNDRTLVNGFKAAPDEGTLPVWISADGQLPYIDRTLNWTERTVYFSRLLRAGWVAVPAIDTANARWERRHLAEPLTLLMTPRSEADFRAFGGPHVVEYGVRVDGERAQSLGQATWCDWDQRGRLIIARDGQLSRRDSQSGELHVIEDFNSQAPQPAASPAWARGWPDRSPSPSSPSRRSTGATAGQQPPSARASCPRSEPRNRSPRGSRPDR